MKDNRENRIFVGSESGFIDPSDESLATVTGTSD